MDRIWQWAWDRYGPRYSWAICAVMFAVVLPSFLMLSFIVVAFEKSDRYVEAAAVTVVALPVLVYVYFLPGLGRLHLVEQWAAGRDVDRTAHWTPPTTCSGRGCPRVGRHRCLGLLCCLSLSVRSLGRPGRGWSSTGFWAPVWELPPI